MTTRAVAAWLSVPRFSHIEAPFIVAGAHQLIKGKWALAFILVIAGVFCTIAAKWWATHQ